MFEKQVSVVGRATNIYQELRIVNPYVRYYVFSMELLPEDSSNSPITIEIRGPSGPRVPGEFKGEIAEGDVLEIKGKPDRNGVFKLDRAYNRSKQCGVGA